MIVRAIGFSEIISQYQPITDVSDTLYMIYAHLYSLILIAALVPKLLYCSGFNTCMLH